MEYLSSMCEAVNKLYVQSELVYKFPEWNLVHRRLIVIVLYIFSLFRSLSVTLDTNDDNYMPYHIHVFGGELSTLQKLGEATQNISR